ncbi:MAG TPA: hypothetical protein VLF93_03590 [Candidatus Saccharimonadales bacterium]|nr:hypothetical protein [Candidatus Saccharimonadales bacterium]
MNRQTVSLGITFLVILAAVGGIFFFINKNSSDALNEVVSNPLMKRQVEEVPLTADSTRQPSVAASKLPEFVFSLADKKFDSLVNAASSQISKLADVTIVHTVYGQDIKATVSIDKEKRELLVKPQDIPNFKPGLYKLSLQLRTLEGTVNINQDFTWGVIAVNTNKSIYQPGETAKIGLGVLDNKGNTLCETGLFDKVDDLSMVVTDPQGHDTQLSIKDNTIKDSGKCGPNTVTNEADFQSNYTTTTPGIYQMKVTATVYGKTRQIEDYFKVDQQVQFDVERTSFPTRIYPEAPYPVTLTVTSKQGYQGEISDIVPSFFGIIHVDGGTTEKDGNFTKIVWNAHLSPGQPQTFSYFIKFPMISPEFYLIGPLQIGSFQEARQWQVASDAINSSTGVVTYEDNGSQNTFYRTWTGTSFSTQGIVQGGATTPTNSKWFSEKSSPKTGEKLVTILDSDTADTVYVYRWNGVNWGAGPDIRIVMTSNTTSNQSRCMDVAFEQNSGDAIFVYANKNSATNPNQILYRKYNSSTHTWDSSDSVTTTATNPKAWVRLVSEKNSDNILMGYVNNVDNHVGAEIWNGTTWNNEIKDNATDSPTAATGHIDQTFDIAWETNSQAGMIVWGNASAGLTYRRFTSSWSSETSSGLTFPANVDWVNVASDDASSSNNIAIATQDLAATPNCKFAIWNGSTWTLDTTNSAITCRAHTTTGGGSSRENNVVFEHNTGKAVWVYITSGDISRLHYHTWTSGGGFTSDAQTNATTAGGQSATFPAIAVQLYSDPFTVGIIAVFTFASAATTTATVEVWDQEWDGSSWTAPGAGNSSANLFANVQAADEHAEAYGFGFDLNLETQAAYRWFANSPGTDTTVTTALAAQDTPTTLTSANQKFRLRMLLYYPDSLASGGRSYILQYVDPGTGTCSSPSGFGTPANWADVPNVNDASSTIAYFDNTGVASASAATVNALDPTYNGKTKVGETYNEQNTFTTNSAVSGDNVGLFDFSLVDKTTFGRTAHTFCFRVKRSSGIVLQIGNYPQITTAALNDVLIQGGSQIRGGTTIQ